MRSTSKICVGIGLATIMICAPISFSMLMKSSTAEELDKDAATFVYSACGVVIGIIITITGMVVHFVSKNNSNISVYQVYSNSVDETNKDS